jgi:hypothetical protein
MPTSRKRTSSLFCRRRRRRSATLYGFAWFLALPGALLINGKPSTMPVIEKNGELYVSLSALKMAGMQVTHDGNRVSIQFLPYQGGASQADAVEGGPNAWLNNGIWRMRVLKVEPTVDPFDPAKPGYNVTMEARNAVTKTLTMFQTGVKNPQLVDENGAELKVDEGAWQTRLQMKEMLQGGGLTATIAFYYPHGTPAADVKSPAKLVLPIDTANGLLRDTGLKYAVKSPTLRIWLKPDAHAEETNSPH